MLVTIYFNNDHNANDVEDDYGISRCNDEDGEVLDAGN